uniref:Protein slit n=1 Tax=Rhabditophanes sp. KR3021 TaxID=114890 RepID=A0AC35U865_9BILA
MVNNRLREIPADCFKPLQGLLTLDLSGNNLVVEPDALALLQDLFHLSLKNNSIQYLTNVLTGLKKLNVLSLENNKLTIVDTRRLPNSLTDLFLRYNQIKFFHHTQEYLPNLVKLDLAFNEIEYVAAIPPNNYLPSTVQFVSLAANRIKNVQNNALLHLDALVSIDLRKNKISEVKEHTLKVNTKKERPSMKLWGNPLVCSCDVKWLIGSKNNDKATPNIFDSNSLICHHLLDNNRTMLLHEALDTQQILCNYDSYCVEGCDCCLKGTHCECLLTCPPGCKCLRSEEVTLRRRGENLMSCSSIRLDRTELLPNHLTELHLIESKWRERGINKLTNMKYLKVLNLSDSSIESLESLQLLKFPELEILDLRNNKIETLNETNYNNLGNIRQLNLGGNPLTHVNDVFINYATDKIDKIWLSGRDNEYGCSCKNKSNFQKWFEKESSQKKIQDYEKVECLMGDGKRVNFSRLLPSDSFDSLCLDNNKFTTTKPINVYKFEVTTEKSKSNVGGNQRSDGNKYDQEKVDKERVTDTLQVIEATTIINFKDKESGYMKVPLIPKKPHSNNHKPTSYAKTNFFIKRNTTRLPENNYTNTGDEEIPLNDFEYETTPKIQS